jgi:pimeloyl-ACP methyl ester carboxylesterase
VGRVTERADRADGKLRARRNRASAATLVSVLTASLAVSGGIGVSSAAAAAAQPSQPHSGPGGSASPFGGLRVTAGGSGFDAWYAFEPTDPTPKSAPLAVVMHGYYEYSGYDQMYALIRHTVLKGNVVIFPQWQTGIASPCPGPINIEPCIASSANAIHAALSFLRADRHSVQPRLDQASYFGFSFGGILTSNLANRYRTLHLPKPRAIFLDDPHDGGLTGFDEPALDASLAGIPPTVKFECHSGADGVIAPPQFRNAGCNSVFPKLGQIPAANKSLVLTSDDSHGQPVLSSAHGVCAGGPGAFTMIFKVDAYDWGFCWKVWDALRACAYYGKDCKYALGDTPEHRYIGTWSDGLPIIGLQVQRRAPIRALPAPRRQAAPPSQPNPPPLVNLNDIRSLYASTKRIVFRGTAASDNGVAFVEVAVVRRAGARCAQMTPAGAFVALAVCNRPTSFVFATGTTRWSVTLPVFLRRASYQVFARAIDSFGRTPGAYTRESTSAFSVSSAAS